MLTRLKIDGFKNLMGIDVRFGPFTCIAGPNAVGKSNLFDAIRFLSALASKPLMEAALSIRNERTSSIDVLDLFHRVGDRRDHRMVFEAEMIAPQEATDDLGRTGKATANFLKYTLALKCREAHLRTNAALGPIEIEKEELVHIHLKTAGRQLLFPHDNQWRKSVLHVEQRQAPFISTTGEGAERVIYLHQDGGGRGRGISHPVNQPRTVLSVGNASESQTVLCAKREMESWGLLQLEPSALREPDGINAPFHLEANGLHLPSTLYHLAHSEKERDEQAVYACVANRLSELVDDVQGIEVDYDRTREMLTVVATDRNGTRHAAHSLSDGTLRFLALTVLEADPATKGLLCLEEPENGIHPERIPAMLTLLRDIATDCHEPVDATNPLRQIIINTHSPAVVLETTDDSLLVIEPQDGSKKAVISHLTNTWRANAAPDAPTIAKGRLLAYLNPVSSGDEMLDGFYAHHGRRALAAHRNSPRRVIDRQELNQLLLPHIAE